MAIYHFALPRTVKLIALTAVVYLAWPSGLFLHAQQAKIEVLRVGTSGTLSSETDTKEKSALDTLRSFIKTETGLNNEIIRQKDWHELADKMAGGTLHLGVFQGYEFAWAHQKHAKLKPLALAVNVNLYPVAYVITRNDNEAKNFADLQTQSLCLPETGQRYLRLFVERQCEANKKPMKEFFSKIAFQQNVEDAIDDVVDGVVSVTAIDRASLEQYKHRKPGRFKKLKNVVHSEPFPPVLVAYYDNVLDEQTLQRFRDGLLNANRKERGQTMLTLFRLTSFEPVPKDFAKVVANTVKAFPPPIAKAP